MAKLARHNAAPSDRAAGEGEFGRRRAAGIEQVAEVTGRAVPPLEE